jgi:hypothetical protein
MNMGLSEYEAGALTAEPQCLGHDGTGRIKLLVLHLSETAYKTLKKKRC